jgi:UDP-N-acetylmuramate--alanine ligase
MQGHKITGSDIQSSAVVERLGRRDIHVSIGHDGGNIPAYADCVVVSAAVKPDNPEYAEAVKRNLRICKYAEMLGELSRDMKTLAVAGTHGKSTTSGWLAYTLKRGGVDPSFVIGADVEQLGGGSGPGRGVYLVAEACEYDRSFLNLRPYVAAILNIEADHLDYYSGLDEIVGAFADFGRRVKKDGLLVANGDDANVAAAVSAGGIGDDRVEYFSMSWAADWQACRLRYEDGHGCFDLTYRGERLGRVKLTLAGAHNVANSLAVAAMSRAAGLNGQQICDGLENFVGVGRRMSYKGEPAGVVVLDDYGHHPTEIRATLAAIAAAYKPRRLWCVFQPHQHSRTRFMLDDFARSFSQADVVLLPDIYFVRDSEQSRHEVNAGQLAEKINRNGREALYLGDFEKILQHLCRHSAPGDLVVTMGAGDIWKVADELICRLGTNR